MNCKSQFGEAKPRSEIRSFGTGEIDLQSVKSAVRVKFAALRRGSGPAAGIVMGKGGALPSSLPLCGKDFTFRFAEDFTRINGFHFFAQQKNSNLSIPYL